MKSGKHHINDKQLHRTTSNDKGFFHSLKAQSAIEYLMTYGWMLLVVAIVGGAIFSVVGDQNISSVTGFEGESLQVSDFGVNPTGLSISAQNNGANEVRIREVKLSDGQQNRSIPLNEELSPTENKVINLPSVRSTSGSNEVDITFITDIGALENITVEGSITGGLEIDQDLQGFWTLSEVHSHEDKALDLSGNQNDAEVVGDLEWSETSLGIKPKFTSSNYLKTSSEEFLNITEELTLSAWVKPDSKDSDTQDYILDYRSSAGDGYYLMHGTTNADQDFQFRYDNSRVYSGFSPEIGEKYHVLGRYDGDRVEIYVDGELEASSSASSGDGIDAEIFTIGNSHRESQNFEGTISNVRVYDRAISDNAVQFLFENPGLVS